VALNTLNHNYGQPLVVSSLNVTGNEVIDGNTTVLGSATLASASIGSVTNAQIQYLTGLTGNVQSQISGLLTPAQASALYLTLTSAASTYLTQTSASNTYAAIAGTTFTGGVTIPTLTLTNALSVVNGGTGLTATTKGGIYVGTGTTAFVNVPTTTDGYILTADSTQSAGLKWAAAPVSLPSQTGNSGKYLTTDGTTASWATVTSGGSGTVTNIATSTGLTGGPITTTGTLAIDTTVVPRLGVANTFTNAITLAPSSTSVAPLVINAPNGTTVNPLDVQINSSSYLTVSSAGATTLAGAVTANYSLALNSGLSTGVVATIKGAASQTGNLVQYQNSSGTVLGGVNAAGQGYIGTTPATGSATFSHTSASASSTTVATFTLNIVSTANPVVVGGSVTTTGFTPSYFNGTFPVSSTGGSSGAWTYTVYNAAATFTASGTSTAQGTAKVSGTLTVQGSTIYSVPIVVQGVSSSSANLQEWQNSSGTPLATVTASGGLAVGAGLIVVGSANIAQLNSYTYSTQLASVKWNAAVNNTNNTGGMVLSGGYNSNAVTVIIKATGGSQATTGITTATANGTTSVTYTTGYSAQLVAGAVVTITGIVSTGNPSATAGSGFNLTAATVTAASATQFTATAPSALTDTYTSGGYVTAVSGIADITQWQTAQGTTLAKVDYQGNLTATKFVTTSGTSSQFVKGDGSLDSSTYLTTGTAASTYSPIAGSSSLTTTGTVTSGTWSASFGAVSGANLTSLTAGNLSGTIPSAVLGNSTHYIGTTAIALNRASASQTLTGVSIDGSAGSVSASSVTGSTLASGVTASSLTSLGTLTSLNAGATLISAGLLTVANGGDQIHLHAANNGTSAQTIILRNDGSNYYNLISAANTAPASASWNTLRPFYINLSSGLLQSDNGQNFNGGTTLASGNLTLSSGNLNFGAANPTIYASSYVTFNNGIYVSGGPSLYTEAVISARGGIRNDTASSLTITGGTSGQVTFTGYITVSSDERLKKDIVKIDDALTKVEALNGYTYIKEGRPDREMGVIAQEVIKVAPELVSENEDDGMLSVSYPNMVALLIEAVKEQSTKIAALEEQVKELKG